MSTIILLFALCIATFGIFRATRGVVSGSPLLNLVLSIAAVMAINSVLFCAALFCGCSHGMFLSGSIAFAALALWMGQIWKKDQRVRFLPVAIEGHHVLLSFGLLVITFLFTTISRRWGGWDAWAQWNLHARHLVNGALWTRMMHPGMGWNHPDYPLMLPSWVAMFWRRPDSVTAIVPVLIAYGVIILIASALYASVARASGRSLGTLAFLLLALDGSFIAQAASQYADTLLALFILLSVVLLVDDGDERSPKHMLLFGLIAAGCGWIKNEGLVFFAVLFVLVCVQHRRRPKDMLYFALGALPVLIIIGWFRLAHPFVSDLAPGGASTAISRMLDPHRHLRILDHVLHVALQRSPFVLPLALIVLAIGDNAGRVGFIAIGALLCAYYLTYLISPLDLSWQLKASCDRLVHHVVPAFLFLSMRALASGSRLRAWVEG